MIGSTRNIRVFVYRNPVDMRKGFDGLYGLVLQELGCNPLSGDIFLFISRNRKRAKALLWDGTGLCLYSKRLEKHCFAALWRNPTERKMELTLSELQLFLEGSKMCGKLPLSPAIFDTKEIEKTSMQCII